MSRDWLPPLSNYDRRTNGLGNDDVTDETKLVSARLEVPRDTPHQQIIEQPIVPPIVHSALCRMKNVQHIIDIYKQGGHFYSRLSNPTCEAAEAQINSLEGGAGSVVFGSGSAAICVALMSYLQAGDHVVVGSPLYSGTLNFLTKYLQPKYNIDISFVGYDVSDYRRALRPNTKVLYGETPSNPMLNILDLEEFGKLGQSLEGVVTMIDSTYGSPYLQKPIKYGIDFSIHSGTKYIGGHSDLTAGVVTARTVDQWKEIMISKGVYGSVLSPFEASLLIRGLRTLHLRMDRSCDNAHLLATWLQTHPAVQRVAYPGLTSDPGHLVAKKQMRKFGAMISFVVKGGLEPAKQLVQNVRVIQLAVSLGGTESLIQHPASMTHGSWIMNDEERKVAGIVDGLIRFSVGVEGYEDLKADLSQAFDRIQPTTISSSKL